MVRECRLSSPRSTTITTTTTTTDGIDCSTNINDIHNAHLLTLISRLHHRHFDLDVDTYSYHNTAVAREHADIQTATIGNVKARNLHGSGHHFIGEVHMTHQHTSALSYTQTQSKILSSGNSNKTKSTRLNGGQTPSDWCQYSCNQRGSIAVVCICNIVLARKCLLHLSSEHRAHCRPGRRDERHHHSHLRRVDASTDTEAGTAKAT